MSRPLVPAALLCASTLVLTACGEAADGEDGAAAVSAGPEGRLQVVTSFYPLEYAVERVAGERADLLTLTAPGVDPHDLELTPQDVASLGGADLVVYSAGLQEAVDDAVASQAAGHALDVNDAAQLVETGAAREAEDEHADDGHGHDDGVDPHFWLDTDRYAAVTEEIADRLGALDPGHAEVYRAAAEELVADLATLDQAFVTGLADCEQKTVVTSHAAFGYLTDRYGMEQRAITGLSPEAEPTPARMAEISETVRAEGVRTIYSEVLLGGDLAETIAAETGAEVRVLDPVEGITAESAGQDYLEVMRANLEQLRAGQGCP